MIMCHLNYKECGYPSENITWGDWCCMLNNNIKYCSHFNLWKWIVFLFWHKVGRIKLHELPSFHPYWWILTNKSKRETVVKLTEWYEKCVEDHNQIKYLFNANTRLSDIVKMIEHTRNSIRKEGVPEKFIKKILHI